MSSNSVLVIAMAMFVSTASFATDGLSLRESLTVPGALCQIVSGPARHADGGVRIAATTQTSVVECPITRGTMGLSFVRPLRVTVVDASPVGSATCTVNAAGMDLGGQFVVRKSKPLTTTGSSNEAQDLRFTNAEIGTILLGAQSALYVECTLSARFGQVHLMSYHVEVDANLE